MFDKHVQRSKRKYWYDLQTDLVKASEADPNAFWKTVGKAAVAHTKKKHIPMEIIDEEGKISTNKHFVLNKWRNTFSSLFSHVADTPFSHEPADPNLAIQHENLIKTSQLWKYVKPFSLLSAIKRVA